MNRGERTLAVLIGALLLGGTALGVIRAAETDEEPLVLPPISPAPATGTVPVSPIETFPTATETTFPSPTETAFPSPTRTVQQSPEPTETPEPTESPEPSPTPTATSSPKGAMSKPETPDTGVASTGALGAMLLGGAGLSAWAARRRRR